MSLFDMCCPKKPKKSLDYVIKWVENADKRFEDIDTYLENLNAAINGDKGLYSRVSGLEVALGEKQDTLIFDTTPTINSTNPVTSGGVATALADKAAVGHSHANIYEGDNNMLSVGEGYINIELYDGERGGELEFTVDNLPNLHRALQDPDTTPTADSTQLVTSGGMKAALDGKANSSHVHNVSDISGLPFSGLHFFVMDSIYDNVDMDELFTPEGFQTMVSGRKTVIVQNSTSSIIDLGAFFISQTGVPVHTNQDLSSITIEVGGYALCTIYLVNKLEGVHEHTDYDFCYFVVLEQVFTD